MKKPSGTDCAFLFEVILFCVWTCYTCLEQSWGVMSAVLFHTPIPCSSGSCCLWFYPGGFAGCYDELSAPDVLCQEDYDVHIDNFVFLHLGTSWGHFCLLSNRLSHPCSFLIFLQLKCSINICCILCLLCTALNKCIIVLLSYEVYISLYFIMLQA